MQTALEDVTRADKVSLVKRIAHRYGVDEKKMLATLKATAFRQRDGQDITNEQMMALLVVADQYKLNPFTREIYAFPDKNLGIVPIVGVDGWSRIINSHPQFDGMEFRYSEDTVDNLPGQQRPAPEWIECIMYRKDRDKPVTVREYLDEVYRAPFKQGMSGPWQTHTRRMLRHKAMIQAARLAFGFVGIYEPDEAERIIEGEVIHEEQQMEKVKQKTEALKKKLSKEAEEAADDFGLPEDYGHEDVKNNRDDGSDDE